MAVGTLVVLLVYYPLAVGTSYIPPVKLWGHPIFLLSRKK